MARFNPSRTSIWPKPWLWVLSIPFRVLSLMILVTVFFRLFHYALSEEILDDRGEASSDPYFILEVMLARVVLVPVVMASMALDAMFFEMDFLMEDEQDGSNG